jgi:hypothetical protein
VRLCHDPRLAHRRCCRRRKRYARRHRGCCEPAWTAHTSADRQRVVVSWRSVETVPLAALNCHAQEGVKFARCCVRRAARRLLLTLDAVFLEPIAQCAAPDAEQARGAREVVAGAVERLQKERALHARQVDPLGG